MARTNWNISKKVSGSWTSDGTIYAPNVDFLDIKTSTQKKIPLANGSFGYVTPSTKYIKDPLTFVWLYVDDTFVSKIEGYIENATDLKITNGITGTIYYGRFIRGERKTSVGIENYYDLKADFELMDGIA